MTHAITLAVLAIKPMAAFLSGPKTRQAGS
jgi:hypothetical protein